MSCHDIGRGLNSVSKVVLELLAQGEITKDASRKILHACRKGVNWCDGNEDEAVQALVDKGYCGVCLNHSDTVSNVYDNDLGYPAKYDVFDAYDDTAAHFFVCSTCKEKILAEYNRQHQDR